MVACRFPRLPCADLRADGVLICFPIDKEVPVLDPINLDERKEMADNLHDTSRHGVQVSITQSSNLFIADEGSAKLYHTNTCIPLQP